ncbi:MAG: glycosyltransferase family 2 protein [Chloroflexota bacterium]
MATVDVEARTPTEVADARVGVSILTYNRLDEVCRTVERMLSLPEQPHIVVVDNGSTDGTPSVLRRRFPNVRCLSLDGNLGAAGRNAGVAALTTPYVALCDDDTWWEPGSLRRAADLLDAYPRLAVLTGRVLVGPENRLDQTCHEMATSPVRASCQLPGPALVGFLAGASMVRRSAFLQVGGFERRFFIGGEEELLTLDLLSASWELSYVADVVVHHHPSDVSRDTTRRRVTLMRNHLWVAWMRYPLPWTVTATVRALWLARTEPSARAGVAEALRALPWAFKHRRVVPRDVQRRLRQVAHR